MYIYDKEHSYILNIKLKVSQVFTMNNTLEEVHKIFSFLQTYILVSKISELRESFQINPE